MDSVERSQYLVDALKAIGSQPQGSTAGTAMNLGAVALNRFAQDRQRRALVQALSPTMGATGVGVGAGMLPDGSQLQMPPSPSPTMDMGGLSGLGQKFMGLFR